MDTHEHNRTIVCILCLSNNKNVRPISSVVKSVIRDHYLKDLDTKGWYYPSAICTSCRLNCDPGTGKSKLLQLHKYKYDFKSLTRSSRGCHCEICNAAQILIGGNLPGMVSKKLKPGRPRKSTSTGSKVVRMCNLCLTEIKQGKKHGRSENLLKILKAKNSPPKATEAAVSSFLAEKVKSSGM